MIFGQYLTEKAAVHLLTLIGMRGDAFISLSFLDQILSSDLYQKNFLFLKKVKKLASKVDHNRPRPFFPQSSPDQSPQPRIDFPCYEISGPDICSLICEVALKMSIYLAFIIHAHEG